jgi:hypothetical protein
MNRLLLLALLPFAASAAVPAFDDPQPQRRQFSARASLIDPRAREHPQLGFVFADKNGKPQDLQQACVDTRVAPQGRLVIWLMGPSEALFERLNQYGLHVIQVHYANKWFGLVPAARRDDGRTLGGIRLEAATGEDHSDWCAIPKPDGMMERAHQFVRWLAREHPGGRWEQFLASDGLRWDKVTVAGSSHGATTAARFAKHQAVDRVVCFCGPRDQLESWQSLPSATPSNRIFAFTHVLDTGWTGHHYDRSWEMMGLPAHGPLVDVDRSAPPYQNTRRLLTEFDVQGNDKRAHSSVVPGSAAARDAQGRFVHEAVWQYLFQHPVAATGRAE